jgi:hypothetical protein
MGVSGQRHAPGERTPGTHCTGGWVVPKAGLDTEARIKTLCLYLGLYTTTRQKFKVGHGSYHTLNNS